jgi:hypothetical protein
MHVNVDQARKLAEGQRCGEHGGNNGLTSISHLTLGQIQLEFVDVTPAPVLPGLE